MTEPFSDMKLTALRDEIKRLTEKSKSDEAALRDLRHENDLFRLTNLNYEAGFPSTNQMHLSLYKGKLHNIPIEEAVVLFEIFQLYADATLEVINEKRGRSAIKSYVDARDAAKIKEAKAIRENQEKERHKKYENKPEEKILYSADRGEHKAISAYVKMGFSVEKAREMIDSLKRKK